MIHSEADERLSRAHRLYRVRWVIAAVLLAPSAGLAQHHHRGHGHRHRRVEVPSPSTAPATAPSPVAPATPVLEPAPASPAPSPTLGESAPRRFAPATPVAPSMAGCVYLSEQSSADEAQAARWAQGREHHTFACRRELGSTPPDYNGALTEYQRAYQSYEGHPERYRLMGNVGRCQQALGQYEAALTAYRRFLDESPENAPRRAQVEGMVGALEATLGTVTLTVNVPGALIVVDNREVGVGLDHVRVPMGRHVIEMRASGFAPSRQEVQLSAMETVPLRFNLESLGRRGVSPVFFWSSVGVALGAATAGAVFGGRALSLRGDITARQTSADERSQYSVTTSDGDRLQSLSLTADLFFAGAALFGVGATVLGFLTDFRRTPAESPRTARVWTVVPILSSAGRGASVTVAF